MRQLDNIINDIQNGRIETDTDRRLRRIEANPHASNCRQLTTEEWLEIITNPEVRAFLLSPPKSAEEVADELIEAHQTILSKD
ncbi:MAG: hypothetical protein IKQ46_06750 [Bacteroidales bacterium]|nr:hypothetical protein [Bacteroidales bacterium]